MIRQRTFAIVVSLCCCYAWTIGVYGETLPSPITTPPADLYVPADSDANVTFSCTTQVSGEAVIWAVAGLHLTQITQDRQFSYFESRGVYIDPRDTNSNSSSITISRKARYDHGLNQVQCHGFEDFAVTGAGPSYYVIVYDPPTTPAGFTLQPSLELKWSRPSNVPPEVSINYTIEINATEEGGMSFRNFTSNTSLSVQFLEDMLPDFGSNCVEFEFFVTASNDAGTSPLARIKDTIPISPDVRSVSRDLRVVSVDLQSRSAQIMFPPVNPCNVNFSLTNYTINIDGAIHSTLNPSDVTEGMPLTINNLTQDTSFSLTITACNNVTCRTSESRDLNTTDVQTVQAVFYRNRLFLNCSFAENSQAQGCVFKFIRSTVNANGTDRYNVSHQDLQDLMCIEAPYRRDAYGSVVVMDWEKNGEDGSVTLPITNIIMNVSTLEEFTNLTRCPEDSSVIQSNQLSPGEVGGIAGGIVIAVGIAVAVTIVIVTPFLIKFYKKRATLKVQKGRPAEGNVRPDSAEVIYGIELETKDCEEEMEKAIPEKNEGGDETSKPSTPPVADSTSVGENANITSGSDISLPMDDAQLMAAGPLPPPDSGQNKSGRRVAADSSELNEDDSKDTTPLLQIQEEVDKRVKLVCHDPDAPLTLEVQWKSLIDSLLARDKTGNKKYNFSKLKVELKF